jgi:hypothetical protein
MTHGYHADLIGENIHVPYAWSYADAAAREGAGGFLAGDVGKLALQEDDGSLWLLTEVYPNWVAVADAGGSAVDAADVTFTPAVATDWDGDADPGDTDDALDQLAERIDDIEPLAVAQKGGLLFVIDGGEVAITTGIKGDIEVPFDCEIQAVTLLADQSGSIVVDIWVAPYADYPPTDADSITAAAPPTITAAVKSQDATLTDWTVALTEGDILRFNVDSVATVERVTVSLKVTRT